MKKQFVYLLCIGILNFVLFSGVFRLLQHDTIYRHSLGLISQNYERTGGWDKIEINRTTKPFIEIKNNNFETWDAAIYKCISESMYRPENDCFSNVRAAFFPLFPVLWKITGSSPLGISVINYFLFAISLALLMTMLTKASLSSGLVTYAILLTLPSAIIFYIPYSEALFMFTMTLAVIGILKKRYLLFFAGSFLMAMVRPATVFVLIAFVLAEFAILLTTGNYRLFFREIFKKTSPFIAGYVSALGIQYLFTGSWTAYFEAQKNWAGGIQSIKGISDWSLEGFGLSTYAVFLVSLPAVLFLLFLFIGRHKPAVRDYMRKLKKQSSGYLFLIAVLYLAGIFAFTLITSGGNLHSFSRFMLASPLFYIALIILIDYLSGVKINLPIVIYLIFAFLLLLFFYYTPYGGARLQFSYFGLYMFIATGFFLMLRKAVSMPVQIIISLVLIGLNTVWNTYLLNAFFSNGWIFT